MTTESFSNAAILNAIIALDSEICREHDMLEERELDEQELDAEEDSMAEMVSAFEEFVAAYRTRRQADHTLPSLEEVLGEEP